MMKKGSFSIVDLFCGAGGLSSGFLACGFEVRLALDNHAAAVETYAHNLGAHVRLQEIAEKSEFPEATVLIGGPPCQGFSSAGSRRVGDGRNSLVSCFAHLVSWHKPMAFVFENVEGFLTAEGGERVFDLLGPLVGAGYQIHLRKVNAANYGVPQHRKRVIAIGGLGWDPGFPGPTHFASGAPGADGIGSHLPPAPTLARALGGLPPATTSPPGIPQGHVFRRLEGIDLERAMALAPGQTMQDLPPSMWHESFRRRAYRRVKDGTPTERRGGPPAGIKRLRADQPSKTITSGAVSEFLHPSEPRPLTLRECASLQTFPDEFEFFGSANDQAHVIGNAVPPLFARVIAEHLACGLTGAECNDRGGRLLSFVPTISSGMSPALKQLVGRIHETFPRRTADLTQGQLWD